MPNLDQPYLASSPAIWTGDKVRQRLVEAFSIERRMPSQARVALASSWPATPLHSFTEMLFWEDARKRIWDSWSKAKGVYPYEVSRMEEALGWLSWLEEGERRCLAAWALASARGLSLRTMLEKRQWSRTTFYRRIEQGARRIADRLNQQGVQLR
jgi:asparagine synthetase B (glutamine-hydrolysing)